MVRNLLRRWTRNRPVHITALLSRKVYAYKQLLPHYVFSVIPKPF